MRFVGYLDSRRAAVELDRMTGLVLDRAFEDNRVLFAESVNLGDSRFEDSGIARVIGCPRLVALVKFGVKLGHQGRVMCAPQESHKQLWIVFEPGCPDFVRRDLSRPWSHCVLNERHRHVGLGSASKIEDVKLT